MPTELTRMDKLVALCKRRGFIFQSSEIYGGINGFWDYGPLGVELKRNIKEAWWQDMVRNPPVGPDGREVSMVGVDCSIIMNPKVWEASGHATGFADPMVDDKETKQRVRADQVIAIYLSDPQISAGEAARIREHDVIDPRRIPDLTIVAGSPREAAALLTSDKPLRKALGIREFAEIGGPVGSDAYAMMDYKGQSRFAVLARCPLDVLREHSDRVPSPFTGKVGTLTELKQFNLMNETYTGAVQSEENKAYLRPETAQGIFVNFKNVCDSTRVKLPFGIAQIGKAFRNEINPRNYTFRSREFEQMEIEFFCHDKDAMMWWEWWRDTRINWYKKLGLTGERLRPRNQTDKELAHYSKACTDIEYMFPFSDEPQELEGVAHRGCFDLTQHARHSGKDMSYFDDESKEKFVPTVIEPSAGADRATLAFLCDAYGEDPSRASPEFLKLHPRLAPIKAAVFPLVNKDGLPEIAEPIHRDIRRQWPAQYDPKQSIGKRYARMDEAGTPFCFTVDGQTKEDGTVTVRDRDSGGQQRIDKSRVVEFLRDKLSRGE